MHHPTTQTLHIDISYLVWPHAQSTISHRSLDNHELAGSDDDGWMDEWRATTTWQARELLLHSFARSPRARHTPDPRSTTTKAATLSLTHSLTRLHATMAFYTDYSQPGNNGFEAADTNALSFFPSSYDQATELAPPATPLQPLSDTSNPSFSHLQQPTQQQTQQQPIGGAFARKINVWTGRYDDEPPLLLGT